MGNSPGYSFKFSEYGLLEQPYKECGIIIWRQTFTSYLETLVLIQRKIVRAIAHQHPLSHALPIFKSLKQLQLYGIFKSNYYASFRCPLFSFFFILKLRD